MKEYYVVKTGEVIDARECLGEFESLFDAKEVAFADMTAGDMLVWADQDGNECEVWLEKTDDSIEDVPEGLYYWSDDMETYYNYDGSEASF